MIVPKPEKLLLHDGAYVLPAGAGLVTDAAFSETREGVLSLLPMLSEGGEGVALLYDASLDASRYRLCCDAAGVRAYAGGPTGALYAASTLRQLIENGRLPYCEIEDGPHFAWRGQHFDICRHFFPVKTVETIIDLMALYKMNRFHLHLSDDQGFRFESERFPRLNSVGSWRASSAVKRGRGEVQDGLSHGGYYTKAELRRLVAYAKARGVEIVPEIDLPGHTGAILAAYPELACFPREEPVVTRYGIQDFSSHILCAGRESVFDFLFALLDEIAPLFPFPYFHIGGDEAGKSEWKKCPRCQAKIKELGLSDERALQGWFSKRLADHLAALGKRAIVWNDGLTPLLTPAAVCQHWTPPAIEGDARTKAHLAAGGEVIMSGFRYLYFDYPYAMTPLQKAYYYQPWPKGTPPEDMAGVLGVESCLWTEWIEAEDKVFFDLLPRLCASAELGWHGAGEDYRDFVRRLPRQYRLFDELGLPYAHGKERPGCPLSRLDKVRRFFLTDANVELRG